MSIIVKAKYKKGFFARKINADTFMKNVQEYCKKENYDARLMRFSDTEYAVQLVPTGLIRFHITDSVLLAESNTSVAGPGFHKAVFGLLDAVSSEMNISFDYEDPTDYVYNKAFAHLQKLFVRDLEETFTNIVSKHKNDPSLPQELVGWDRPFLPLNQKKVITMLGSYSIEELDSYLQNDFLEFAKKYFVWFNESKDALLRKQTALFALWNVYKWRRPMTREEMNLGVNISRNLEMARMISNEMPLPTSAWQYICAMNGIPYLNLNEAANDEDENIGYLKGNVSQLLPLNYRLTIAGTFDRINHENAVVLSDMNRQVVIQVAPELQPEHITDPRTMLEKVDIQEEIDGYLYVAMWSSQVTSNNERINTLTGFIQGSESFVNVAISFSEEQDRNWALEVFKSFETPASLPLTFASLDNH